MKHTIREVVLENGLKGLVITIPNAPVVSLEISFRAGEFLLSRQKWETAHIMEHLMLGANNNFASSREFQAELEKNGAYSNASTSAYDVTYDIECAAFEADRVTNLVVQSLMEPQFLQSEFEAEFGNVAEELIGRSNNHFRTLNLGIRVAQGLYAVSDIERSKLMKHVTKQDVEDHYKQTHSVANARFLLAGDSLDSCLAVLETLQLPSTIQRLPMPEEVPVQLEKPVLIVRKNVPNYYFYLDTYAPAALSSSERDSLSILSTILTETLHSKLLGTARERGLVYAMGSGHQQLKSRTSFWLGAQVSKQNAQQLFELTAQVLQECKNTGVTSAELEAAKMYLRGKHERSAQTATGTLNEYSSSYYFDDTIEYEEHFVARLNQVSVDSIKEVMQKVTSGVWTMGILGNLTEPEAEALYGIVKPVFAN